MSNSVINNDLNIKTVGEVIVVGEVDAKNPNLNFRNSNNGETGDSAEDLDMRQLKTTNVGGPWICHNKEK